MHSIMEAVTQLLVILTEAESLNQNLCLHQASGGAGILGESRFLPIVCERCPRASQINNDPRDGQYALLTKMESTSSAPSV
jgi:hypothetical protein